MDIVFSRSSLIETLISQTPHAEYPLLEFEKYKQLCLEEGEIPAPLEQTQREYIPALDTIGRDRFFTHPIEARAEELHHAHIWQEGCVWEDDLGVKVQWSCTSDSYIVYSYFVSKDEKHHFFEIDYRREKAHSAIQDPKQVHEWAVLAKEFREDNQ